MRVWRVVGRGVGVLALVLVVGLAAAWAGQREFIYYPERARAPVIEALPEGAREVTVRTADGLALKAWYVPAPDPDDPDDPDGADDPEDAMTVLVAPGSAGSRPRRIPMAHDLSERGLAVFFMEYRGYGDNPGSPTEDGLTKDALAAYDYLTERLEIPPERLIYLGESLGTGVVTRLASTHPPAGLVLRSPFTELADAGAQQVPYLPLNLLLRDRYPIAGLIDDIDVPTVVVYGTADETVPPELSRTVAERAAGPVRVVAVEGADHNDAELGSGEELIDAIAGLAEHTPRTGRRKTPGAGGAPRAGPGVLGSGCGCSAAGAAYG